MLVLLSPAKTIDFTIKESILESTIPDFIQQSLFIVRQAKQWSVGDISKLMGVSENIAQLNFNRFQSFSANFTEENSKQALFLYNGDAYQGLSANTMSNETLLYTQEHLRIFSGLYGILRPFDLIQPYRLEMGIKFKVGNSRDLYHFWSEILTQNIENQLNDLNTDVIVNLASVEYFKVLDLSKLGVRIITPSFYNHRNGKYQMISFWAKKARGMMTRFIMENQIENPEYLEGFDMGYFYDKDQSKIDRPVFISEF